MTIATSTVWPVITALLAAFRADPTLSGSTYNVLVVDGPLLLDASRSNILFVGGQPSDPDMISPDATVEQDIATMSKARDETLTVACELWVRAGDTDLSARRATAQAILAAVEGAIRPADTLGVTGVIFADLRAAQLYQEQSRNGSSLKVPFTITIRSFLT